jgi:serine/threonine-protein kinase
MSQSAAEYLDARAWLQTAVAADPKFAEAWVALAGTYWTGALDNFIRPTEAWPEVDRSLAAATAVSPSLPDLHFGRAIKAFYGDRSWSAARREWQVASQLPDQDIQPELLLTYAMSRWAVGDAGDALKIARRARAIDPLSPIFAVTEATYLAELGRWDEAAAIYTAVISAQPDAADARFGLAEVRRAQGRFDEAVDARVQGHRLSHHDDDDEMSATMAAARGAEGYRQLEVATVTRIELPTLEAQVQAGNYASPLDFARAYAQLGDADRAFAQLSDAFEQRAPGLVFLNVDHAWNAVRSVPAFREFVARVGLPSARA